MNKKSSNSSSSRNSSNSNVLSKGYIALLSVFFISPWLHGLELSWEFLLYSAIIFTFTVYYLFQKPFSTNLSVLKELKLPLLLLSASLLYQLIQIIPLPVALVQKLNGHVLTYTAPTEWATLSIATNTSAYEIIKNLGYLTTFILIYVLLTTKSRILTLTKTLFFSSLIIAIYSLVNHYTEGAFSIIESIPPWTQPWKLAAHGTFSYQNHYASFLTLTIPLGFALIFANTSKSASRAKKLLPIFIDWITSSKGFYLLAIFIMCLALVKTSSRGGNIIFIASIIITWLMVLIANKHIFNAQKKYFISGGMLVALTVVVVLLSGIANNLINRYDQQGLNPHGRNTMYQTGQQIIQDYPLFGSGTGTYPVVHQQYNSPLLGNSAMSKRAHNDYFEILCNQGIIGVSLLFSGMLVLLFKLFLSLKKAHKSNSLFKLQIASCCSVIAICMHSFVDFNFHLPVNTVYFFLVLALGLKSSVLYKKTQIDN